MGGEGLEVAMFGRAAGLDVTVDFDRTAGFGFATAVLAVSFGLADAARTAGFGLAVTVRAASIGLAAAVRTAAFGFAAGFRTAAFGFGLAVALLAAAFGLAFGLAAAARADVDLAAVAFRLAGDAAVLADDAAGLAADIVLADTVSAFAALLIALVAVLIACMAVDRVLADAVALVAAEVSRVAAVVTLAAADETVLAAVTVVGMFLAAPTVSVLTDFLVVFLLLAVFLLVVLVLALAFGRLAALLDGLPRSALPDAAFAEPRRLAVRVLLCTGIDLPPMFDQLRRAIPRLQYAHTLRAKESGRAHARSSRRLAHEAHKSSNHCHRTLPIDRDRATLSGHAISGRGQEKVAETGPRRCGFTGRPRGRELTPRYALAGGHAARR